MPNQDFQVVDDLIEKGVVVIRVKGDIDAHTTKLLQASIQEVFKQGRYRLIIDLADVGYMSSSGASLLIVMLGDARENKGNLVLMNVNAGVRQVMDLLGLSAMFIITDNQRAALSAFN